MAEEEGGRSSGPIRPKRQVPSIGGDEGGRSSGPMLPKGSRPSRAIRTAPQGRGEGTGSRTARGTTVTLFATWYPTPIDPEAGPQTGGYAFAQPFVRAERGSDVLSKSGLVAMARTPAETPRRDVLDIPWSPS